MIFQVIVQLRCPETRLTFVRTLEQSALNDFPCQQIWTALLGCGVALVHTATLFAEATSFFFDTDATYDLALACEAVVGINCQKLALGTEWSDLHELLLVSTSQ